MKISNTDDIIARIEELEQLRDQAEAEAAEGRAAFYYGQEERDELASLRALADEAEPYVPDWEDGAELIRETYFVDYCKRVIEGIGDVDAIPDYLVIDWYATSENLRVDHTEVDFAGEAYLVR